MRWRILRRIDSASDRAAAYDRQGIRRGQCGVEWNDNSDFQFVEPEHKPVFERDRVYGPFAIRTSGCHAEWTDRKLRRRNDHGGRRIQ